MIPDKQLVEKGILIVTGSTLRAEQADRPLAYSLKQTIENHACSQDCSPKVLVMSDLWYLNSESLHAIPMISIGGPGVNAVAAHLLKRLPNALVVENSLIIQMDLNLRDLRVCIWGANHELTVNALDLFIQKQYLQRFLSAVTERAKS